VQVAGLVGLLSANHGRKQSALPILGGLANSGGSRDRPPAPERNLGSTYIAKDGVLAREEDLVGPPTGAHRRMGFVEADSPVVASHYALELVRLHVTRRHRSGVPRQQLEHLSVTRFALFVDR
jgi:hypothetical protein